jgi:hypothetical protein
MSFAGQILTMVLLSMPCDCPRNDEDEFRKLAQNWTKLFEAALQSLRNMRDQPSAEREQAEWKKIEKTYQDFSRMAASARDKPEFKEKLEELSKQLKKETKKYEDALLAEYLRVCRIPGALTKIKYQFPLSAIEGDLIDQARLQLDYITTCSAIFKTLGDGKFPAHIEDLAREKVGPSKKPLMEPKDLIDPWGRPYKYDSAEKRNGGHRPDIWSLGRPYEENEKGIIGNWDTMKELDRKK